MESRFAGFVDELAALPDAAAVWQRTADFATHTGYTGCSVVLGQKTGG
ncbi:MAG: hypothetical protein ACR2OL_01945 [Anderseniella sp.]